MRYLAILLVILICLSAAGPALAGDMPVSEAPLTSGGRSYELNRDAAGNLYATDWRKGEVWRVAPGTGAYTLYGGLGSPNDARPDSAGDVWFTNYWVPTLGRINTTADPVTMTTWDLSAWDPGRTYWLGGLAFDEGGKLWFSEWDTGSSRLLYRFDPATNQLCGYTLPGGDHSYYVLYNDGFLWLGDWDQGRLVRFDPTNAAEEVTYWAAANVVGEPRGLVADDGGNIWWADATLDSNTLGRLNPSTNELTIYTLPDAWPLNAATPYMLAVREGEIWYAAHGSEVGTIGVLDPLLASGSTSSKRPSTADATETCASLGEGTVTEITAATDTLGWTGSLWSDITPGGATGWSVYKAPSAEAPYGISTDTSSVWTLDQTFNKLMRMVVGLGEPWVAIENPGGTADVQLTWDAVPGATSYRVWYSEDPYFVPGATPDAEVTATSYTHAGVVGDPDHNTYYVVRAVAAGAESANSNRVGKFDYALVPGSGGTYKYNAIALPLQVAAITDADSLASTIGGVYMAIRYNAATQDLDYWLPDPGSGTNFPTEVGGSYFLYLDETAPATATFLGNVPPKQSVLFSLVRGSTAGDYKYNPISIPLDKEEITTANQLALDVGGVYMVIRYNAATQDLTYWLPNPPSGTNFAIAPGYPYFVYLKETGPDVWPLYP